MQGLGWLSVSSSPPDSRDSALDSASTWSILGVGTLGVRDESDDFVGVFVCSTRGLSVEGAS